MSITEIKFILLKKVGKEAKSKCLIDRIYKEGRKECWEEMKKHQPFGWIKIVTSGEFLHLLSIGISTDFNAYFNTYTFADGSPFGIKEE